MPTHRRWLHTTVLVVLFASVATGCASTDAQTASSSQGPVSSPAATSPSTSTPSSASRTVVPKEVSDFPEGVYRTQLTVDELQKQGITDLSNAGIWTLTVEAGSYQLDCRAIADPEFDCGNSQPSGLRTVEFGSLHGVSPTVWFVHDMARLSEISGCVRHSSGSDGCGPEGGYHMDWKEVSDGIAFSNFGGLGDEAAFPALNNWTAKPWTRIS